MTYTLTSRRVLTADGTLATRTVVVADGIIDSVTEAGAASGRHFDVGNCLIAPGIIDLHGDAFERQVMPRPGVHFPMAMALRETDRQMIANGMTTAFHGLTWSWEPGLRSGQAAHAFADALDAERPHLACDTRLHLRYEAHTLEAVSDILRWIATGRVSLLAFNNHMETFVKKAKTGAVGKYAERASVSNEAFVALVHEANSRDAEVPAAIRQLAEAARAAGIPMASHDDMTPEMTQHFHALGCTISEFPLNRSTADAARALGSAVVLGAPNVIRGGSHTSGMSAGEMVGEGVADILTSDYFYPALLHAPFRLQVDGRCGLAEAWRLISSNPARYAGLTDRGDVVAGKRADLVVIDDYDPTAPRVLATIVAGKFIWADHRVMQMVG